MTGRARNQIFLQAWILLAGIAAVASYIAQDHGYFAQVIEADESRLSILIGGLFLAATAHAAWHIVRISRQIRAATDWLSAPSHKGEATATPADQLPDNDFTTPAQFVRSFVADVMASRDGAATRPGEQPLVLEIYADRLRAAVDVGWYLVDILIRLGLIGTRKTKVWSVTDRNKDRVADEVKDFAPSLSMAIPNGPCFSPDGFLYIAEQNRVLVYPAAEFFYESPDVAAFNVLKQGTLIPPSEESDNHTARTCRIGPDGKLYISLGQPFNVAPKEKLDLYKEQGIGGIIRVKTDGSEREVYTYGVRNSVGMDFNPANGELWFTDNQVDGMGDNIPPGELNRQTEAGQHFGHPWYGGGTVRTNEYKDDTPPEGIVHPAVEMDAHAADLGMTFYTGNQFPAKYKGGIFSAQHGSWNRTDPIGARVMFTAVNEDGSVGATEVFAEGWLNENGEYLGRPVDVAVLRDGSILVSDDLAGAIYRISYGD